VIAQLHGKIVASEADGTLVVDVGGVGYEVLAPLGTAGRLAGGQDGSEDGRVVLYTHLQVREDAHLLFGFTDRQERAVFRSLLSVAKVGPKLALAILSAMSPPQLSEAVNTGSVAALKRVSGIGKKTAERIVLELKGKLDFVPQSAGQGSADPVGQPVGQGALLHDALVRMGFRPSEAERAVAALEGQDRPLGELVRDALKILAP